MAMEFLSKIIENEVGVGSWKPFAMNGSSFILLHLMFANDLVLYARADDNNASVILRVVQLFSKYLSFVVNMNKNIHIIFNKCYR